MNSTNNKPDVKATGFKARDPPPPNDRYLLLGEDYPSGKPDNMQSFKILTGHTFRMNLFSTRVIASLVLMIIPLIVAITIAYYQEDYDDGFRQFGDIVENLMMLLLMALCFLNAIPLFNREVNQRTLTYLTIKPVPRWLMVLSKFTGYWISATVLLAIPTILIFFIVAGKEENIFQGFDNLLGAVIVLSLAAGMYGSFFMMLGVKFKHPYILGLVFAFVWELLVSAYNGMAAKTTFQYYIRNLLFHMVPDISTEPDLSSTTALLVMAIGTMLFVGASIFILKRKQML